MEAFLRRVTAVAALILMPGFVESRPAFEVAAARRAQPETPQLTQAVNDLAGIVDAASKAELERRINALMAATGDVVVVATVPNIEGFMDIREAAVKIFENRGRGIGQKGKDNGLLVLVAMAERQVAIEVGYDLEGFVTDGFAGRVIREQMRPQFREGNYGQGLVAGATSLIQRIAEGRGVELRDLPRQAAPVRQRGEMPCWPFILMVILLLLMGGGGRRRRRRRLWGVPYGWSSGVGPFGGGFGGFGGGFGGRGGRGGGFGGFGGFGGGRSGGGGAAGGW